MLRVKEELLRLLPRTQTSLSLDENERAKEGGKEPSVPFPWSLAVHHQSLAPTLRKTKRPRRRLLCTKAEEDLPASDFRLLISDFRLQRISKMKDCNNVNQKKVKQCKLTVSGSGER